jgi:hypothetical protein
MARHEVMHDPLGLGMFGPCFGLVLTGLVAQTL